MKDIHVMNKRDMDLTTVPFYIYSIGYKIQDE